MQQIHSDEYLTETPTDQRITDPEAPHALRWLGLRWTFGMIAGWYLVLPLIALPLALGILALFGSASAWLGLPLLLIPLAAGGAAAGHVTWRIALAGRVPVSEWRWTSAAAAVLGWGLLAVVIWIRPPLYTIESYDSGTHVVYTLVQGFELTEFLKAFALIAGLALPHWFTLRKHTRRAWLIWPAVMVLIAILTVLMIGHDHWLARDSGNFLFEFSPYLVPLLGFVLAIPPLSGLLLTVIGWRSPRKIKD